MSNRKNNSRDARDAANGDDERVGNGAGQEPVIPIVDDEAQDGPQGPGVSFEMDRDDHDRLLEEREHGDLEYSDEERLELFKLSLFQNHLPPIPTIPGYHVCWLTTANPRDPIHGRLRWGYQLIQAAEVPGFEHSVLKTGDYAGCIGVNEMVAAKLPLRIYAMYMTEAHHTKPMEEEERLKQQITSVPQAADKEAKVFEEDGVRALGRSRRPRFEGLTG